MAYCKNAGDVVAVPGLPWFNGTYSPGAATPDSGIYQCEGCGHEVVSTYSHPLPPQNHHEHKPGLGPIRWRLFVKALAKVG